MKYTRGTTITLRADPFKQSDGTEIVPDTVTAYLDYPIANRAREQATVTLSESDDIWSGTWDSSAGFPGTVFFSFVAENGDGEFHQDGQFQLTANLANADP